MLKMTNLSNEQRKAVESAITLNYGDTLCIFAGAGMGKSFVIKNIYENSNSHTVVTATTNEAAFVLDDLGIEATTIFKALGIDMNYKKTGRPPVVEDGCMIIVDEVSMLTDKMISYIRNKYQDIRLVLVGDPQQLTVNRMFDHSRYKKAILTRNFRSANDEIKETVGMLKSCVDNRTFPKFKISDSLISIKSHRQFVDMARKDNAKVLAYTNTLIERYWEAGCDAMTIHKAQGKTYDVIYLDLSNIFMQYKNRNNPFRNGLELVPMLKLIYVGVSRAREKVVLFTGNTRDWKYWEDRQ